MAGKVGKKVYKSKRWGRVRVSVFDRDGWKCTSCGRRGRLECDHLKPIVEEGDWFDLANLRTLCRGCHIRITRAAALARGAVTRASGARQVLKEMAYA